FFNRIALKLQKMGIINAWKWEGRYAELSYSARALQFGADLIHYWPVYCHNYVRKRRARSNVCTVADVYAVHPFHMLDLLRPEYDKYGLDIRSSYVHMDAERNVAFLEHEDNIITNSEYVKNSFLEFAPGKNIYVADYG